MISVTNKKIDFNGIFKNYLENYDKRQTRTYYDELYGDCYDGFYDEDYCSWWEQYEDYKKTKSNKSKKNNSAENLIWDVDKCKFVPKSEYDKDHKKIKDYNSWDEYIEDTKSKNKKHSKKSRKNNTHDSAYDSEYESTNKFIYFYPDVLNKRTKITFHSLFEFDEYITEKDYDILESDTEYLINHDVVHCTVTKTSDGQMRIVTDNSYGSLVWSCQEVCDLSNIYD